MSETATVRVTYHGPAAFARLLVSQLRSEGCEVQWTPPEERRDLGSAVEGVVVGMVVYGLTRGIEEAVTRFRERHPRTRVEMHSHDEDESE